MMKNPEYHDVVKALINEGKKICDVENYLFTSDHTVVGNMLMRSWLLPAHVSKAILHHHDVTIFTSADERIHADILKLIGLVLMAERIVDEHLHIISHEWLKCEQHVLN
jgi:HD-like signal output (HDOD) protein